MVIPVATVPWYRYTETKMVGYCGIAVACNESVAEQIMSAVRTDVHVLRMGLAAGPCKLPPGELGGGWRHE